jgi:hypothetical protein
VAKDHVFFVTPIAGPGNKGGIAGADMACADAAAGLPDDLREGRIFAAYLWVEQTDPAVRLDPIGPILAPTGAELAPDIAALHDADDVAFFPSGGPLPAGAEVWIGNGEQTCADWTLGSAQGTYAIPSTGVWDEGPADSCAQPKHLYCLSL